MVGNLSFSRPSMNAQRWPILKLLGLVLWLKVIWRFAYGTGSVLLRWRGSSSSALQENGRPFIWKAYTHDYLEANTKRLCRRPNQAGKCVGNGWKKRES